MNLTMSISPTHPKITQPKPTLGDISACYDYAHQAAKVSAKPHKTLAYIWSVFLIASFLTGGE